MHGEFNYNAMHIFPPGTQFVIHKNQPVRGTWASHGVKGWYLVPSMNHYWCHHVYVTKKIGEQDSYFVEFLPHNTSLHYKYSAENTIIAAQELAYALKNPAPQAPFSNISESQLVAIEQLSKIFTKAAHNVKITEEPPQQQAEQTAAAIPQTLQSGYNKYIPSLKPNFVEDEEGKEPTKFQHKVHRSLSGPHIITP